MKDLFILNGYKELGNTLRFDAEDENGAMYNVELDKEDIEAYLQTEGNLNLEDAEEDDIKYIVQDIYDSWSKGHTRYNIETAKKKLKGYEFTTISGKTQKLGKEVVGCIQSFMAKNKCYTSFRTIYS